MTHQEILEAIKTGNVKKILGEEESGYFDAKDGVYNISTDKGKFELAKDVAAFANVGGGIIVIGLKTLKEEESFKEVVSEINPIPKTNFNLDGYRKIIFETIYPSLGRELQIDCLKYGDGDKYIIYISVIPIDLSDGPYIVSKSIEENNGMTRIKGNTITLPIRQGFDTGYESAHQLQKMLKFGFKIEPSFEQVFQALQDINTKLDLPLSKNIAVVSEEILTDEEEIRMNELRNEFFNEREGVILSAIFRPQPNEILNIFNPKDSPMSLLANPAYIRKSGWNLLTLDKPVVIGGKYLQVTNGERKIIRLYRDGNIIFGASTDEDFLGHATTSKGFAGAINALAATEVITEFVIFCEMMRLHFKFPINLLMVKMNLFNPKKEEKRIMLSVPEGGMRWTKAEGQFKEANSQVIKKFPVGKDGIKFANVAYQLVAEFFYFFGLTEDKFMYIIEKDGEKEIDTRMIGKIGF